MMEMFGPGVLIITCARVYSRNNSRRFVPFISPRALRICGLQTGKASDDIAAVNRIED